MKPDVATGLFFKDPNVSDQTIFWKKVNFLYSNTNNKTTNNFQPRMLVTFWILGSILGSKNPLPFYLRFFWDFFFRDFSIQNILYAEEKELKTTDFFSESAHFYCSNTNYVYHLRTALQLTNIGPFYILKETVY